MEDRSVGARRGSAAPRGPEPGRDPGPRRERRDDVEARILRLGRAHLAERGAAGLSLRAITRDLGMVSSAVYRYVTSRDDLLTLLLVDAYTELADAVDGAVARSAARPWWERALRGAEEFRAWAVREPARYALLYGSPVPGYAAPAERTVEPGTRVVATLLTLVAEGVAVGDIAPVTVSPVTVAPGDGAPEGVALGSGGSLPAVLEGEFTAVTAAFGAVMPPDVLSRGIVLWSVIVGAVSLEVFGQYGTDTFSRPDLLFTCQVTSALTLLCRP